MKRRSWLRTVISWCRSITSSLANDISRLRSSRVIRALPSPATIGSNARVRDTGSAILLTGKYNNHSVYMGDCPDTRDERKGLNLAQEWWCITGMTLRLQQSPRYNQNVCISTMKIL